tara:strand:- start:27 stop:224 length:198 start_codon:yes stop_codon:yes gene_type:complete
LNLVYIGGAEEARTPDLFNAIEALSQLSYSPIAKYNNSYLYRMQLNMFFKDNNYLKELTNNYVNN